MLFICVRADDKGVFSMQKPFRKLISNLICLLWRALSRSKGLSDLINNHIISRLYSGYRVVLQF